MSAVIAVKDWLRVPGTSFRKGSSLLHDCVAPTITITLQATGSPPDPVLTTTGDYAHNYRRMTWFCESDNPETPLPDTS
jgi:hypothetical protein